MADGSGAPIENTIVHVGSGDSGSVGQTIDEWCDDDDNARYVYREVADAIKTNFYNKKTNYSLVCDMIALYLKGQKALYTEAKTYCELRLSYIMLPSIFIAAACGVLAPVLKDMTYGTTIISSLNGFTAFLLAVVNYLKLDAKAEAHRTAAYKFDKLQSRLVFSSGRFLFIGGEDEELKKLINDAENSVAEIKETDQFILPESVRYNFPMLYGINVFTEIKRIQNEEMMLTQQLTDLYNETYKVEQKLKTLEKAGKSDKELEKKLELLTISHKKCLDKITDQKSRYQIIDQAIEDELRHASRRCWKRLECCGILKT
jgi:hypothetical protein